MTDSFTISKVTVTLNVQNQWVEDLEISLIAPDNSAVALITQRGGDNGDHFIDTVLDQVYNM